MTIDTAIPTRWRKSTRTAANGGTCVEAAPGRTVAIRDSKNPDGPTLAVSNRAWRRFTSSLR